MSAGIEIDIYVNLVFRIIRMKHLQLQNRRLAFLKLTVIKFVEVVY